MSAVVETLEASIDALTDVDLDGLDDGSLHELTVATQRLRDRLEVAAGRVLARWDTRQVWRNDQSLSPAARLSRETNTSPRTARGRLRRAHAMERVPAVTAAVHAGHVSVDHVDLLARRPAGHPSATPPTSRCSSSTASTLRFADAERVVTYWLHHAAPDDAPPDADSGGRRCRRRSTAP